MKKIIAALAITAMFASCKKERVTNPAPAPGTDKRLSHITYVQDGETENEDLTYDNKGRLLTHITVDRIYNFSYENDTRLVVTRRKKSDNTLLATIECTLNDKGAITQQLYKDPAGNLTYTYDYIYNADNYMINAKGTAPSGGTSEMQAEVVNGDVMGYKLYHDGVQYDNVVYYYEGAKPSKTPNQLTGSWPSHTLFGKSISHLITETKTTDQAGQLTWHIKSTYELDAQGYVTKCTTNYVLQGEVSVATYQYQ